MQAIMGHEAYYTGQSLEWDAALNAEMRLGPTTYEWGDVPVDSVPMPGVTAFPR